MFKMLWTLLGPFFQRWEQKESQVTLAHIFGSHYGFRTTEPMQLFQQSCSDACFQSRNDLTTRNVCTKPKSRTEWLSRSCHPWSLLKQQSLINPEHQQKEVSQTTKSRLYKSASSYFSLLFQTHLGTNFNEVMCEVWFHRIPHPVGVANCGLKTETHSL